MNRTKNHKVVNKVRFVVRNEMHSFSKQNNCFVNTYDEKRFIFMLHISMQLFLIFQHK